MFSENIQKQSAYRFMYSNQDVAAIKNISVQREGVSVQEILDIVLKGHNLTYLIEDKIIFIKKQSQTTVTKIRGRVTDTKSEPLAGVTILIEGTCIGTTTDSNGNYVFTIPDIDKINIIYSFHRHGSLQSYLYRPRKHQCHFERISRDHG